jgi:putative membrane protein
MIRRFTQILLLLALVALGLIFGALNPQLVDVELAFTRLTLPLGLALVTALVIGLLAGILWRISWVAQLLAERGKLRRALRDAQSRPKDLVVSPDAGG